MQGHPYTMYHHLHACALPKCKIYVHAILFTVIYYIQQFNVKLDNIATVHESFAIFVIVKLII